MASAAHRPCSRCERVDGPVNCACDRFSCCNLPADAVGDPEIQLAGPEGEAEAADFVMVMGPLVRVLPSLSAAVRQNVRATLEVCFRGHAASQGVVLPAEIWVVQARV